MGSLDSELRTARRTAAGTWGAGPLPPEGASPAELAEYFYFSYPVIRRAPDDVTWLAVSGTFRPRLFRLSSGISTVEVQRPTDMVVSTFNFGEYVDLAFTPVGAPLVVCRYADTNAFPLVYRAYLAVFD